MRVVIIPGMGCSPVARTNWYKWFATEASTRSRVTECILRDFPDPNRCRENIWIPFLRDEIKLDEDTIVVGHSSGAACAMRLLEDPSIPKLRGVILVAAAYTDLGDEGERLSGYFNRPWKWDQMKDGADKISCFHGFDDHLIPVQEARHISEQMKGRNYEYIEMKGMSHFFEPWDEILEVLDGML